MTGLRSRTTRGNSFVAIVLGFLLCPGLAAGSTSRANSSYSIGANLGPGLGFEYRPSSSVGFNLFLGGVGGGSTVINPSVFGDVIGNLSRDLEEEGWSVGLGAVYYPFEQSGFRIGLSLEHAQSEVSFLVHTTDTDASGLPLASGTRAQYDRQATYIGIPMGWMWIFDSGLTLSFDLGPRFRLARNLTWQEGQAENINISDRDSYADDYENGRQIQLGGWTMIGYSF